MGKHKKSKSGNRMNPISEGASGEDGGSGGGGGTQERPSLGDQLISDRVLDPAKYKARNKSRLNKSDQEPEFIDEKMTQKILKSARRQQKDLQEELFEEEDFEEADEEGLKQKGNKSAFNLSSKDAESGEDSDLDEFAVTPKTKDHEVEEIDPEDEKGLELFMNKGAEPSRRLADIIMEKFTEKQTELESQFSDAGVTIHKLDPRVEKMYDGVREIVARYRSGKLPKAFKLIPRLTNWEQVLHITDPTNWSAAAMYQATRIFTSNLKEKMAQRFFNLVLLPRVRDDIMEYKKLNYHLYQALRKALFKPGAFMKGILIPLCESGTCTLREAVIIGSVLSKNSIPILHSSAAMLKIAEMDYSGANSLFLRIFLDKKYALPYRVIDAVVYHFLKFERDSRELPVLWHQALLVFVQRYKEYMSSEQNEAIHALLRKHTHHQITSEIRRELTNAKSRDDVILEQTQNKITASLNDVRME